MERRGNRVRREGMEGGGWVRGLGGVRLKVGKKRRRAHTHAHKHCTVTHFRK